MTDKTAAEDTLFWLRFAQVVIALLACACVFFHRWILVRLGAICLSYKKVSNLIPDGEFVERLEIDRALKAALRDKVSHTVLVYGARGSGKSSQICDTLKGEWGVISIELKKDGHNDVQDEMIESMSTEIGFPYGLFAVKPNEKFLGDLFAACSARPIIIFSMEFAASAEALSGVLIMCKSLSYSRFKQEGGKQARFIVDLSGSRAVSSKGVSPILSRVTPVHIGKFEEPEATKYVQSRMPKTLEDPLRRAQIAVLIVQLFDAHVATLQNVCKHLRLKMPTDMHVVACILSEIQAQQEIEAAKAWDKFQKLADETLTKGKLPVAKKYKKLAEHLLLGQSSISKVSSILDDPDKSLHISSKDLGLWNADAHEVHPFQIDPFGKTISLTGNAITAVLLGVVAKN